MKKLRPGQLKVLSEFFNMTAVAWLSAGIISPLFIKPESILKTIVLGIVAIIMSLFSLAISLYFVRKLRV